MCHNVELFDPKGMIFRINQVNIVGEYYEVAFAICLFLAGYLCMVLSIWWVMHVGINKESSI